MDMRVIFDEADADQTIAGVLGVIDSIESKISGLLRTDFGAGVQSLRQSQNSESERLFLLREARQFFNRAIGHERSLRLGVAHFGLACCHHVLNDTKSRDEALNRILQIAPVNKNVRILEGAKEILLGEFVIDFPPQTITRRVLTLVFSSRSRKAFSERTMQKAIQRDPQAEALVSLQKEVSNFIAIPNA